MEVGKVEIQIQEIGLEPKVLTQCYSLPANLTPFYSFYPNLPLVKIFSLPAPTFKSILIFEACFTFFFL